MRFLFIIILFALLAATPRYTFAQTWKPLGIDEKNTPSLTYTSYSNIVVAPNGTLYIAYSDNSQSGRVSVKKFDGSKWVQVGPAGFSEGIGASQVNLAISPDGTPYVSYLPTNQNQSFATLSVRKLSGNSWVNLGYNIIAGLGPNIAFGADGSPLLGSNFGNGVNVEKFTNQWTFLNNINNSDTTTNISGSVVNSDRVVTSADGTPFVIYSAAGDQHRASVKKFTGATWQFVGGGTFTNPGASGVTMVFSPDGSVYVAYQDSTNGGKVMVQQFKNNKWSVLSGAGLSKNAANYVDLAVSSDNIPYVIFSDNGNASRATVLKLVAGVWVNVGVVSDAAAQYDHIVIGKDGVPYVGYQEQAFYGKMIVKKFNGNKWISLAGGDVSPEQTSAIAVCTDKAGKTYVAFNDALYNSRASVKQFQSGEWQYAGNPGISQTAAVYLKMTISADGTPYIVYKDSTQKSWAIVKKFSGGAWVQIGEAVSGGFGVGDFNISISPDGIPFIAFEDVNLGGKLTVKKFYGGAWVAVGNPSFTVGDVGNINIQIDSNNVPYVAYAYRDNGKVGVQKFVDGTWTIVGNDGFSPGATTDLNFEISPNGTPYVTYADPAKGKIAAEAFINNSWVFSGGPAVSDSVAIAPKLVFNQAGEIYIGYLQNRASNFTIHAAVRKLDQGKWVDAGNQDLMPWNGVNDAMAITPTGDLVYAYLNPQVFVRTKTSDDLPIAPVITSCTPDYGSTGTLITIKGFNFTNTTTVKLGQTTSLSFTVVSPTVITAVVGAGSSGTISVTNPYGIAAYDKFTYITAPPIITSFSPHIGDVNSTVNIYGKNFGKSVGGNVVYFGAAAATIVSANDSTIQVTVPSGASYQPISVTTSQLTAYSSDPFDVTFRGHSIIDATSFAPKKDFATIEQPSGLLISDLDKDGKPDIVVSNYGTIIFQNLSTKGTILLNSQSNRSHSGAPLSGSDLDGDGAIDLIYNDNAVLNKSMPGHFSFPAVEATKPGYLLDFAVTDVDGDGRPDIMAGGSVSRNSGTSAGYVYFEDAIALHPYELDAQFFTLADLDNDGKPDLISVSPEYYGNSSIAIFRNISTPNQILFLKIAEFDAKTSIGKAVVADLDNDGKPDLVVPNYDSNTITVFKNQTTNIITFAPGVDFVAGVKPRAVCIADLNGDGKPDMAVVNSQDNTVSVFKNTSLVNNISFAPKVDYKTDNDPYRVAAADLDGDGAPELIVANIGDNSVSIFKNNLIDFTLPQSNFTLAVTSSTCKGANNGSIKITALQSLNYTATITGQGLNNSIPFTSTAEINNLSVGPYNLCITVAGEDNYQQCYDLIITEPKDLSVYSVANAGDNSVNLSFSGGAIYNIVLNGLNYTTTDNSITLPLTEGNNELSVSTDKICQGVIQRIINISNKVGPYPVPFENTLNINIGNTAINIVTVEIHNVSDGKLVYSKPFYNQSGVLQFDLANLKGGIYALHLLTGNSERIFKIVKK